MKSPRKKTGTDDSSQRLDAVFSAIREGAVVQNVDGEYIKFNEAALKILGASAEQLKNKSSRDSDWKAINVDGENVTGDELPSSVAFRTGKRQTDILMRVHKHSGGVRWISVTAVPLFKKGSKNPYQVLATFRDVTEEKNARATLARKETEVFRVLNSGVSLISYWGCDLKNILANKSYAELFGHTPETLKGRSLPEVFGPKTYADAKSNIEGVLNGISRNFERSFTDSRGNEVQLYVSYRPDYDENGQITGFFIISTDISRIKQLEAERREYESKFVAASKMSALGEMAAGIAHEINNPLAIINGKTALLQMRIEKNLFEADRFRADLETISNTVERIAKTVRGLLAFSRNTEAELIRPVGIQSVIDGTLDLCREKLRNRGVELKLDLGEKVDVECRPTQISQILMNLLNNASDAIDNLPDPWIAIDVETLQDVVKIRVTDSGSPIPHAVAEKLMNPFFTTKEIGKGTGLGLSISKGLAQNHGGNLTYDKSHKHTSFVLELPRNRAASATGNRSEAA